MSNFVNGIYEVVLKKPNLMTLESLRPLKSSDKNLCQGHSLLPELSHSIHL